MTLAAGGGADLIGEEIRQRIVGRDGKKVIVKNSQDVGPLLESNKRLQNEGDGYSTSREFRRIASIPTIIWHQWMIEDGVNLFALPKREFRTYIRRKLADPGWRWLRTSSGAL